MIRTHQSLSTIYEFVFVLPHLQSLHTHVPKEDIPGSTLSYNRPLTLLPPTFHQAKDSEKNSMPLHRELPCPGKQHRRQKVLFPVQSAFSKQLVEILFDSF